MTFFFNYETNSLLSLLFELTIDFWIFTKQNSVVRYSKLRGVGESELVVLFDFTPSELPGVQNVYTHTFAPRVTDRVLSEYSRSPGTERTRPA